MSLRVVAVLVLVASPTGCGTETGTLDVALRTDFEAGADFLRVRTELYDALPEAAGNLSDRPREVEATAGAGYASPRRVAQFGPLLAGTWVVRIELISASGLVLAGRTAEVDVLNNTEVIIDVDEQDLVGGGLPCSTGVDATTIALYTFDADGGGTSITDASGVHHGTMTGGTVELTAGPDGCDDALLLPDTGDVFAQIPSADELQLERGSVELWVRPHAPAATAIQGVISRDALNTDMPGHLSLWFMPDRRIVARLQNPDGEAHLCSNEPVDLDRWAHVGMNFGPEGFELWVDGTRATYTEDIVVNPGSTPPNVTRCGGGTVRGIAGNDNPWVLGASSGGSMEGSAEPTNGHFRGGAIDHLRVASDRREFGR